MKNKGIIFFIVIILVIVAGFLLFNTFLKENVIEQEIKEEVMVDDEITLPLVVPEQAGGDEIFIERVDLPDVGYLVIHMEKDGKPGEIIGVSDLLPAGIRENFLIKVDEEVVEGDMLFAMIHTDDGDGIFDVSLDVPFIDDNGDIILVEFVIVSAGALEDEFKL